MKQLVAFYNDATKGTLQLFDYDALNLLKSELDWFRGEEVGEEVLHRV